MKLKCEGQSKEEENATSVCLEISQHTNSDDDRITNDDRGSTIFVSQQQQQRPKMKLKREGRSKEEENATGVRLEISQHKNSDDDRFTNEDWGPTFFVCQTSAGSGSRDLSVSGPQKKLILFALRLAALEKAASSIGTLGFIWATVVLLGGFAVTLVLKDFCFVTVILLIEAARIASRSLELAWLHQATSWSFTSPGQYAFQAIKAAFHPLLVIRPLNIMANKKKMVVPRNQKQRTWSSSDFPNLQSGGWIFLSINFILILYWIQPISAVACTVLSLIRLIEQDYGETSDETRNRTTALNIFYALALAEGFMFLMVRVYWVWKIDYCKLLDQVGWECNLKPFGMLYIKRVFYDSYSKCIGGSIFDGLKMDLVSFALELVDSNSRDEQLIGAQVLHAFATNEQFESDTLLRIRTSTSLITRLIEMLNWKDPPEEVSRKSAAVIVSKLAGIQGGIRFALIPGALESISSLLSTDSLTAGYDISFFNHYGLIILKKLARDHDNCGEIGNARGLLPKIIDFTRSSESLLRNELGPELQIKIVKQSLQLVKILVSRTGQTGKVLRKEISENVFALGNIREILQYGEHHMVLQKLGIEVLTGLALDEEVREMIGSTGGVIKLLLSIFLKPLLNERPNSVNIAAGEALAMLALQNPRNCKQILKEDVVGGLISLLNDPELQVYSSRILLNLCAYSAPECFVNLVGVKAAVPTVLKAIMVGKEKLQEVSIGLAKQIFRFITPGEYDEKLELAGIEDADFAKQLIAILKRYGYPEITKVPRIRRFVIELMIWLMKFRGEYLQLFKNLAADEVLKGIAETTLELESFDVFSGTVGLSRTNVTLSYLVDTALELIG